MNGVPPPSNESFNVVVAGACLTIGFVFAGDLHLSWPSWTTPPAPAKAQAAPPPPVQEEPLPEPPRPALLNGRACWVGLKDRLVKLRAGPSHRDKPMAVARAGAPMRCYGEDRGWRQVGLIEGGTMGYLPEDLVAWSSDAQREELPVAELNALRTAAADAVDAALAPLELRAARTQEDTAAWRALALAWVDGELRRAGPAEGESTAQSRLPCASTERALYALYERSTLAGKPPTPVVLFATAPGVGGLRFVAFHDEGTGMRVVRGHGEKIEAAGLCSYTLGVTDAISHGNASIAAAAVREMARRSSGFYSGQGG